MPVYFAIYFTYRNLALKISCYNNCFYNLYKSTNIKNDSDMLKQKLYNIIIKHFLHYLKINK